LNDLEWSFNLTAVYSEISLHLMFFYGALRHCRLYACIYTVLILIEYSVIIVAPGVGSRD